MGGFKISPGKMQTPIGMLRGASNKLGVYAAEINEIADIMEENCDSTYAICVKALRGITTEVTNESKKVMMLSDSLDQISLCYAETDQKVLDNITSSPSMNMEISANVLASAIANPFSRIEEAIDSFKEKYSEAKERYNYEVENGTDGVPGELRERLEDLQKHLDDPGIDWSERDYTEQIDDWLKEYEKQFDLWYAEALLTIGTPVDDALLYYKFYEWVKTTGPMDIKQSYRWEEAFGFKSPNDTEYKYFLYHGQVMDPGTLGNVVYAYLGSKYFPEFTLYAGGGFAQIKNRDISDLPWLPLLDNYGDMPEDHQAIELGIKWRKEGFPDK